MEIVLTIVIISSVFALLSLTPLFKSNKDESCEDEPAEGESCATCASVGGCAAAADRITRAHGR